MVRAQFVIFAIFVCLIGCSLSSGERVAEELYDPSQDSLRFPGELHLRNIRQLTFGGNNAEAYWSFDDSLLIFQSDWKAINPQGCDQMFIMRADGRALVGGEHYRLVSTGKGRTTCGYFLPDGRILYASTHAADSACPPVPEKVEGRYVWPIYDTYDIYVANPDGSDAQVLIGGPGYDAEATVSPDGRYVVFTSDRSGDLELWRYDLQTGELLQLTNALGYDGGAFFSPDSKKIVWRASRPKTPEEIKTYKLLLAQGLVQPTEMDVYIADIDGSNIRQVTDMPGAQWAPFFHPSGEKVLFCSNHHHLQDKPWLFDIFMIDLRTGELEQITHSGTFDAFPMFSFDGKKLVFGSNRRKDRQPSWETNIFVADWIEHPTAVDSAFGLVGGDE